MSEEKSFLNGMVDNSTEVKSEMTFSKGLENTTKLVKVVDLKQHPLAASIYDTNVEAVKALTENIKLNGLINRIIVNTDLEILSGNMRMLALLQLGIEEVNVSVVNINKVDELDFIISSNIQRVKTDSEVAKEILKLYEKYSPGQGVDGGGVSTVDLVSMISGYSKNRISEVRRLATKDKDLLNLVNDGKLTLQAANKKAQIKEKNEREQKTKSLYPELATSDPTKDKLVCPCCSAEVKRSNDDYLIIKALYNKIEAFINSIKKPAEAA